MWVKRYTLWSNICKHSLQPNGHISYCALCFYYLRMSLYLQTLRVLIHRDLHVELPSHTNSTLSLDWVFYISHVSWPPWFLLYVKDALLKCSLTSHCSRQSDVRIGQFSPQSAQNVPETDTVYSILYLLCSGLLYFMYQILNLCLAHKLRSKIETGRRLIWFSSNGWVTDSEWE